MGISIERRLNAEDFMTTIKDFEGILENNQEILHGPHS